ncbi:MAG TPA: hypothetical protein VLT92_15445 [Burkholderiales bacterium]|nr:hypothetical protein [Burkholderiales bacterium]
MASVSGESVAPGAGRGQKHALCGKRRRKGFVAYYLSRAGGYVMDFLCLNIFDAGQTRKLAVICG